MIVLPYNVTVTVEIDGRLTVQYEEYERLQKICHTLARELANLTILAKGGAVSDGEQTRLL